MRADSPAGDSSRPPRSGTSLSDSAALTGRLSPETPRSARSGAFSRPQRPKSRGRPSEPKRFKVDPGVGFDWCKGPHYARFPQDEGPKKEAWSFVCRMRGFTKPLAPEVPPASVTQIFQRHWQQIRQSKRPETDQAPKCRLEKGVVGKVSSPSFRAKPTATAKSRSLRESGPSELTIVTDSATQESSPEAPASPSTPARSPTFQPRLSRQGTKEKLHLSQVEAGLEKIATERLPRVRTFQFAADKEDEDVEEAATLSRDTAAFRELKAQVAAARTGTDTTEGGTHIPMPFTEDQALEVFTKLAEYEELHESELGRAMKMLGYMHPNEEWIREIYFDVAPTYNTIQINEYFIFVKAYAAKHHEACSHAFSQYQVGGLMDGPALQEALRNFDIELLPYVVQEILDEVNQGEALDLSHFESALELILLREGFSRKEYDEFQMLYNMSNRDSSGEVQVAELKVMLHWLGFSASHMAPQLASQVERNGSGSLNFLEFMACMRLLRGIELDHVQELMQAAEHDESGKLDVKELPALLNSMGYETWDLQVIDETLEDSGLGLRCSRLGLGDVWRFLMEFRRKEGFCRDELKALSECFKHHDEDNSGELDNVESPLALRMLGFPVGYNEVQRWLLKVDVDESGALNLVEFRKLARMLQANDMNHFREVFDVYVLKVGNSGTLSRENAVTVLDSMGFCVGPAVFDSAHVNENQFLTVCYGLIKERRVECRRNGGWSAEELKWLRTEFDRYIPPGRAYVANKDLIRLLQDILPQMSRDPLFRPELRAILRQVEVESTGKLGFSKYLTFLQLCRSAKEKSVARRQQAAVEEVGFNQIELQELRDLFLDVAARPTCITFEEVWKLINSTTPLGHNLTVELQQIFNEQLMKRSDVHEPPEQALDFADFLRFMRRLMDMNFAKLAHDQ